MTVRPWPKAKRMEAERLAAEVGVDEAARRLDIPRGTVVSWVSRAKAREAKLAERTQLEAAAAEVEAGLQVELEAPKNLDELGQAQWLEKNLEGASAKLTIALAGGKASDARNYATVVGILTDKLKAVRAEVAAKTAERLGDPTVDPRVRLEKLMDDLGGRRLRRSTPDQLEEWAATHERAAVWLHGEAERRRAGEPPSVEKLPADLRDVPRARAAMQVRDRAAFTEMVEAEVDVAGAVQAAVQMQREGIDEDLVELAVELGVDAVGQQDRVDAVLEEGRAHAERLVLEEPVVDLVEGGDGDGEPEVEPAAVVSIARGRAYGEARDEAFKREFGRYPWDDGAA